MYSSHLLKTPLGSTSSELLVNKDDRTHKSSPLGLSEVVTLVYVGVMAVICIRLLLLSFLDMVSLWFLALEYKA